MLFASTLNWTLVTPRSSAASAVRLTAPETVAPSAGAVSDTVGGEPLSTVAVTPDEVVELPAASFATAVNVCDPLAPAFVSHDAEYGALVSAEPRLLPSSLNCTLATPRSSLAPAVTDTVPETVAPLAGAVIETAGGVESAVTVAFAS